MNLKPLIVLEKIPEKDDENIYGFDKVTIWYFNYDGQGNALVTFDDDENFNLLGKGDLDGVLFGVDYENPCYRSKFPLNL